MTRRVFALRGARMQLLLLLLLVVRRTCAFPASDIPSSNHVGGDNNDSTASNNVQFSGDTSSTGDITEYPVFIPETEQDTQTIASNVSNSEPEVATETFMVIEEQETDDGNPDYYGGTGGDSSFSTESPAIIRSTLPMQAKSIPEQEEVLVELRKLREISEEMSDEALKNSLSSLVHLAYAKVYVEPEGTLYKLKNMLKDLLSVLRKNSLKHENMSTTETSLPPLLLSSSTESNHNFHTAATPTPTSTPTNMMMTATVTTSKLQDTPDNSDLTNAGEHEIKRSKRSYYDDFEEIENIFFANVNSQENSVIPEEKNYYKLRAQNHTGNNRQNENGFAEINNIIRLNLLLKNNTIINGVGVDPLDRIILSTSSSTTTVTSLVNSSPPPTPSPATVVQKVIHINDRQKPSPSFFLTPERIKELKSKMTSTTSPMPGVFIGDELENEVNSLQSQEHLENFDIHISDSVAPLTTSSLPPFSSKPTTTSTEKPTMPATSSTESPFTAEEIALALFQLLRPETSYDDSDENESGTPQPPKPAPSNILYQVGPLSSIFNLTEKRNDSAKTTTTTPSPKFTTTSTVTKYKVNKSKTKNATLLAPPAAFANLGNPDSPITTTSTERVGKPEQDIYDYQDTEPFPLPPPILPNDGLWLGLQSIIDSVASLSVSAKLVLLFSTFISILSIGFGLYALGPPLAGVGVLGIIIPIGLLFLFETSATTSPNAGKKRKLTRERQQELLEKIQSEEFSKILNMIFDAAIKYNRR